MTQPTIVSENPVSSIRRPDPMTDIEKLFEIPADVSAIEPSDEAFQGAIDWWRSELEDAPPLHGLRTDAPRSSSLDHRLGSVSFCWEDAPCDALRELCERHEVPGQLGLMAGFAALVGRYTDQNVVVVGVPMGPALRELLPVRFDFSQTTTFEELLGQARSKTTTSLEHAVPIDRLADELDVERTAIYQPIAQLVSGGEPGGTFDGGRATARFDLALNFGDPAEEIEGTARYNAVLFERETIQRLLGHLRNLIDQSVAKPSAAIGEHSLPTDEERRIILEKWNDTEVPVDLGRCFHEIFEEQVDQTPDSVAVVQPGGGSLTYRELDRRSNQIANQLLEEGVDPEDLVAICVERTLELVAGIMGIMKSGAAYLPINPTYPEERIDFILEEISPPVAVTESGVDEIFASAETDLLRLDADRPVIDKQPETRPDADVQPGHLAYMVYTSGSTGRPKGVMIEHRNVTALAATLGPSFGVEADDRVSQFVSETFDATIWEFAMTFTEGATLVLLPSGRAPLGLELGRYLRDEKVSVASLPPAVVPDIPQEMAEGLETMIVAGEACPAKVVENWSPGRRFINGYGPRETTAYATCADCEPTGEPPPIGRPLGNYKTYVLDDDKQLLPVGVDGELYIGGPGVGRGYKDRPELNADKFVPDPFVDDPDARMYRTGDVVRWRPDGDLAFVGRADFQVQLRGFRVELGAIEEELRKHEAVSDAVATKHAPDDGPQRLVGYVVPESDTLDDRLPARLKEFLGRALPGYMVPSYIVPLEEFPLNTTGKVDRHALPAPETGRTSGDRALRKPRNEVEETLAAEWKDLLGMDEIGVQEDFFDLGGTSLMIARLALRIRDAFDLEVSVKALYETPTVEAIARRIEESEESADETSQLCFNPSLDLDDESELAADISGDGPPVDPEAAPKDVLLTGATGFVGAHLLAELLASTSAKVHCLIRGRGREHLHERLRQAFARFELDTDMLGERVEPVVGDLAEDRLGLEAGRYDRLASTVDAVYHNGAKVDQVRSYGDMKPANVTGTKRMLQFACAEQVKPFHYVSTLGSVHHPDYAETGRVPEEAPAGPLGKLPNGYMQTKCVGEHVVQKAKDRGIPASIYRLGAVSGHTETGACEPDDYTYSIIRTAIDLGVAPDLNPDLMITPVDFVASSIVTLSRWGDGSGETFHVTHPQPNHLRDVIGILEEMGHAIDFAPFDEFLDRLSAETRRGGETPLLRFLPYLSQRLPGAETYKAESYYAPVEWDCENLQAGLAAMGEPDSPPPIDELIRFYIENLTQRGFLTIP